MPRVRFLKIFDWPVNDNPDDHRVTKQFLPGMRELVTHKCAEAAVAAEAAEYLDKPEEPVEEKAPFEEDEPVHKGKAKKHARR